MIPVASTSILPCGVISMRLPSCLHLLAGLIVAGPLATAPAQDVITKPAEVAPAPAPPATKAQNQTQTQGPATVPATRPGGWMKQHEGYVERARAGEVDLLFLGDSITYGWNNAKDVWSRSYGPRKVANFGIGGDRTQHVLWRIENGELDTIKPKVVVLMIGTNNLGANTDAEIADGVRIILDRLHSKLPETKVLLLGVFPRGSNKDKTVPTVAPDPRIAPINTRLATFDDGGKTVKYLDIGSSFLVDGQVSRANMPDMLHLTPAAYQIWADAMEPTLWTLMEGKPGS